MWPAPNLVSRGVFMKLRKSETDRGSSKDLRCAKWSELRCL